MKISLLITFSLLISCSKTEDKTTALVVENASSIKEQVKAPTMLITPAEDEIDSIEVMAGDTISQALSFKVGDHDFEFTIQYVIKTPYKYSPRFNLDIIYFNQVIAPESFSNRMYERLKENFGYFYRIPLENYQKKIRANINEEDIGEFFIIKDYNLDGIDDFGISISPSGNNVFEDIYININGKFVYWKGLSEIPIWHVDKNHRRLTTGWHMSADIYSEAEYEISADTILNQISRTETYELDEDHILKKSFVNRILVGVDTLVRQ
jgi:hypothetical protein